MASRSFRPAAVASNAPGREARTRWARTGIATRLTSSGVANARPETSARACTARKNPCAPRGETPRIRSRLSRVRPTISRMYSISFSTTVTRSVASWASFSSIIDISGERAARIRSAPPAIRRRRSSARSGYPREIRIRKRSSCDSGSGYVPRYSTGFCVARTRNGSGRSRVRPSEVTARSLIACRSAACVFGVARLISSARRTGVKTGPGCNG